MLNAVVTGSSRGIGLGLVKELLSRNFKVYAWARKPDQSEGLKKLQRDYPGKLELIACNVTSDSDTAHAAARLGATEPVDLLINNAGIFTDSYPDPDTHAIEKLPLDSIRTSMETNALAPIRVTRALLPALKQSRNPQILNMTSLMGSIGDNSSGGYYAYRMSKAALNMFNKSFAIDYPSITSVVVHPGWVKTDMGGLEAPLSIHDSVRGILNIADRISTKQSGLFFDAESGEELAW